MAGEVQSLEMIECKQLGTVLNDSPTVVTSLLSQTLKDTPFLSTMLFSGQYQCHSSTQREQRHEHPITETSMLWYRTSHTLSRLQGNVEGSKER